MLPSRKSWSSRLPALLVIAAAALTSVSCARSQAQQPGVVAPAHGAQCEVVVVPAGADKNCPTARIDFQVSVQGCRHSSGTFDYEYQRVSETRKVQVAGVAKWYSTKGRWMRPEPVPLACDEEILDVQIARSSCTCAD